MNPSSIRRRASPVPLRGIGPCRLYPPLDEPLDLPGHAALARRRAEWVKGWRGDGVKG